MIRLTEAERYLQGRKARAVHEGPGTSGRQCGDIFSL
jgi:hypothetical protein